MSGVTWRTSSAARTGEGELGDYHVELRPNGRVAVDAVIRDGAGRRRAFVIGALSVDEAQRLAEPHLHRLVACDVGATDEDLAALVKSIRARRKARRKAAAEDCK